MEAEVFGFQRIPYILLDHIMLYFANIRSVEPMRLG